MSNKMTTLSLTGKETFKNGITHEQLGFLLEARNNTLSLYKSIMADTAENEIRLTAIKASKILDELDNFIKDTFEGM